MTSFRATAAARSGTDPKAAHAPTLSNIAVSHAAGTPPCGDAKDTEMPLHPTDTCRATPRHAPWRLRCLTPMHLAAAGACLLAGSGAAAADGAVPADDRIEVAMLAGPVGIVTDIAAGSSARTTAALRPLKSRQKRWNGVVSLALSPDGSSVAVARSNGLIRIDDSANIGSTRWQRSRGAMPAALAFVGNGTRMVSVGQDSVAQVWDATTGNAVLRLSGHEQPLRTVAASADGRWIATAGDETRVLLWNGANGRLLHAFTASNDFVNALAFSPDGSLLAAAGASGRVLLWSMTSGALVASLAGHSGQVLGLAFSPDGKRLATAGEDLRVALWSLPTGALLASYRNAKTPLRSLAFSPSGTLLASAGVDGSVTVWDTPSGQAVAVLDGDGTAINALLFNPKRSGELVIGTEGDRVLVRRVAAGLRP